MEKRRLITLLMLVFFTAGVTGCGKTSDQEFAEKKEKELRRGEFHDPPAKSW